MYILYVCIKDRNICVYACECVYVNRKYIYIYVCVCILQAFYTQLQSRGLFIN